MRVALPKLPTDSRDPKEVTGPITLSPICTLNCELDAIFGDFVLYLAAGLASVLLAAELRGGNYRE